MIKLARIVASDSKSVKLLIEPNSKCSDCKTGCSEGFLGFLFPHNSSLSISMKGIVNSDSHLSDQTGFFTKNHKVDDVIGIKFKEDQLYKLAFALYGVPIFLVLISLVSFSYLFKTYQLNQDIGGVIGMISGLLLSKIIIKMNQIKFKPQVEFFK